MLDDYSKSDLFLIKLMRNYLKVFPQNQWHNNFDKIKGIC